MTFDSPYRHAGKMEKAEKKEEEGAVVQEDVYLLGVNLRGVSLSTAVGFYTIGIFITYITMFIIQESVFKTSKFEQGGLLVVCNPTIKILAILSYITTNFIFICFLIISFTIFHLFFSRLILISIIFLLLHIQRV